MFEFLRLFLWETHIEFSSSVRVLCGAFVQKEYSAVTCMENVRETYFLFSLTTQTKQGCALNDQVKRMRIFNVITTWLNEITCNFSKF